MRLISLNTWGGKLYDPFMSFLSMHSKGTDIFCLQEVYSLKEGEGLTKWWQKDMSPNLYEKILHKLEQFNGNITEQYSSMGERLAIISSKRITIEDKGEIVLCEGRKINSDNEEPVEIGSKLQWITFMHDEKRFTIANVHGFWVKDSHEDSPERLQQSKRILNFLNNKNGAKILCGDFNLSPNTRSISMLEQDFKNLIKEYEIISTGSSPGKKGEIVDYVFVSPEVKVSEFKVLQNEVSDHLPLSLEFS